MGRLLRGAIPAAVALVPTLAWAGPPFVTDDPEPVEEGHFEINNAVQFIDQGGTRVASAPGIDANYGPAPDTQIHLGVSLAYAKPPGQKAAVGYGDTELGLKYRVVDEDEDGWVPQISVYPNLEIPTGNAARGLGEGFTRAFLPIWIEKTRGPWTVYGGGGYWLNQDRARGQQNYWFTGIAALRKLDDDLALGGEIFGQTPSIIGAKRSAGFNLGGTLDLNEISHILFSGGRGLVQAGATDRASGYLAYQVTF